MRTIILSCLAFCLCLGSLSFDFERTDLSTHKADIFVSIDTQSPTPFDIVMQVLTHQRCMNCHPSGDRPRQGMDSHLHNFNVQRGPKDRGLGIVKCTTCHQSENNNYSGVPGAPHWHLAPKSMAWEGLTRIEIAQSMLDRFKNGGRSLEEIERHLTEDPLVLWAFEPGINNEGEAREKPPVSREEFVKAVKQWVEEGAQIPNQ